MESNSARVELEENQFKIEHEESIKEWKNKTVMDKRFKAFHIPRHLINCLLSTSEHNGLILFGEGGIGKTVLTLKEIKERLKPKEWQYSNGYTTPLALYSFLYKHAKAKVLILDDVEGLFNHQVSMSILKGALWDSDGKRIVQYKSTSKFAEGLPEQFVIKAKIIILCNKIPNCNDISVKAMISRTIPYEMNFSYEQKLSLCKQFVEADTSLAVRVKGRIVALLEKNTSRATKDFNFRTLKKLIAFMKYDESKAEELFLATTVVDEDLLVYDRAVKYSKVVGEQVSFFVEHTGKKRATFFRLKRRIVSKSHKKTV